MAGCEHIDSAGIELFFIAAGVLSRRLLLPRQCWMLGENRPVRWKTVSEAEIAGVYLCNGWTR